MRLFILYALPGSLHGEFVSALWESETWLELARASKTPASGAQPEAAAAGTPHRLASETRAAASRGEQKNHESESNDFPSSSASFVSMKGLN